MRHSLCACLSVCVMGEEELKGWGPSQKNQAARGMTLIAFEYQEGGSQWLELKIENCKNFFLANSISMNEDERGKGSFTAWPYHSKPSVPKTGPNFVPTTAKCMINTWESPKWEWNHDGSQWGLPREIRIHIHIFVIWPASCEQNNAAIKLPHLIC